MPGPYDDQIRPAVSAQDQKARNWEDPLQKALGQMTKSVLASQRVNEEVKREIINNLKDTILQNEKLAESIAKGNKEVIDKTLETAQKVFSKQMAGTVDSSVVKGILADFKKSMPQEIGTEINERKAENVKDKVFEEMRNILSRSEAEKQTLLSAEGDVLEKLLGDYASRTKEALVGYGIETTENITRSVLDSFLEEYKGTIEETRRENLKSLSMFEEKSIEIWDKGVDDFKNGVREVFGGIMRIFEPVIAPLKALVAPFKGVALMARGLGRMIFGLPGKLTAEAKMYKDIESIKDILSLSLSDAQKEKRMHGEDKKDDDPFGTKLLKGLLLAAGLAIGAFLGAVITRFKILSEILHVGPIMSLMKKIPLIGRFFSAMEKVAGWFGRLAKGALAFATKIPIIGKFFTSVLRGIKFLGWPLQIILSLIDFVKGFKKKQGSMLEKIGAGLWEMVKGFLDGIVMVLKWPAKLFGVDLEKKFKDIMDPIDKAIYTEKEITKKKVTSPELDEIDDTKSEIVEKKKKVSREERVQTRALAVESKKTREQLAQNAQSQNEGVGALVTAINNQSNQSKPAVERIPEEPENFGIFLLNGAV